MSISERLRKNPITFKLGVIGQIVIYDYIVDTYDLLKVKLRKMHVLKERRFERISALKNKYKGERCFIVATGPSLTMEDLSRLKGEYVFGVNAIVKLLDKLDYIPNFLGIQDMHVYDNIGEIIEESPMETIFVTDALYKKKVKHRNPERFIQFPLYSCRHSVHGERRPLASNFSLDVSKVVYSGYSITYSMLQIAVYMGFTEIYLLGCDCSYDTKGGRQYFVESGHFDKYADSVGERMIYAYTVAYKVLKEKCPNVKVFNATRGGQLEVFPRKTIDELSFNGS